MAGIRTSQSDPIRVAWLPSSLAGKVGLTIAPGKSSSSKSGAPWKRDLGADLDRLARQYAVKVLVCLLQEQELGWLKIPGLVSKAQHRGMIVHHLPIPDGGVLPDLEPVRSLTANISIHAHHGHNVVIHCAGGLGRSGTIGGCWLVTQGMKAGEAIETLHRCRSFNCPETKGQEKFIHDFERAFSRQVERPSVDADP